MLFLSLISYRSITQAPAMHHGCLLALCAYHLSNPCAMFHPPLQLFASILRTRCAPWPFDKLALAPTSFVFSDNLSPISIPRSVHPPTSWLQWVKRELQRPALTSIARSSDMANWNQRKCTSGFWKISMPISYLMKNGAITLETETPCLMMPYCARRIFW